MQVPGLFKSLANRVHGKVGGRALRSDHDIVAKLLTPPPKSEVTLATKPWPAPGASAIQSSGANHAPPPRGGGGASTKLMCPGSAKGSQSRTGGTLRGRGRAEGRGSTAPPGGAAFLAVGGAKGGETASERRTGPRCGMGPGPCPLWRRGCGETATRC